MKCPLCRKEMVEDDFGAAKVNICKIGCRGIWFDWFELNQLDENHEGFGAALKDALESPRVRDEDRGEIDCPKCGVPMLMHRYESAEDVTVDECFSCGGMFLDSGELKIIRDTHMGEQEQGLYLQALLDDVPGHHQAERESDKEKTRADALRKFIKFLRLHLWTPDG